MHKFASILACFGDRKRGYLSQMTSRVRNASARPSGRAIGLRRYGTVFAVEGQGEEGIVG